MSKIKENYMKVIELFFKISYLFLVLGTFNSYIYSSPIQSGGAPNFIQDDPV